MLVMQKIVQLIFENTVAIIDIKTSNGMYKITVMTINFILRKNIYTVLNDLKPPLMHA